MLEVLIGLVVATLAVIGWFYGSLFVCIFLSIPTVAAAVIIGTAGGPAASQWAIGALVFLIVVWAPYIVRRGSV